MTELLTELTKLTSWGACWGLRDEAHSRGRNYPFPQRIHTLTSGVMNTHRSEGFSRSSVSKESACNAGDPGLIPVSGRYPGEGNGNPLQYSCLENPIDRGAWQATIHGVTRVGPNIVTNTYHKRLSDLSLVVLGFPGS